jgi:4-hydroxybenzoate polyprenyltransferase
MPYARSDLQKYWRLYRVKGWLHFLGLTLLGFFMANQSVIAELWPAVLIAGLYLAHVYAINNYFDRQLDLKLDKNPLAGKNEASLRFLAASIVPAVFAVVLTFRMDSSRVLLIASGIIASTFYSVPPLRLKVTAFIGFMLNALIFAPLFLLGWVTGGGGWREGLPPMLFFSIPVLIMQVLHEMADINEDRRAKIKTIGMSTGHARQLIVFLFLSMWGFTGWLVGKPYFPELMWVPVSSYAIIGITVSWLSWRQNFSPAGLRLAMRWLTVGFGLAALIMSLPDFVIV